MVYSFIENLPFDVSIDIPRLRFVEAALAISQTKERDTFLVEELICEQPFVKYINNDSGKPSPLADSGRARIARFLAFCQHIQWQKTSGLIYVSDYQGSFVALDSKLC